MSEPAIRQPSANRRWPMTAEAWLTLVDELGGLRNDLTALAEAGAQDDVVDLPAFKVARRFDVLSAVFDAAHKVHEPDRAVIGRRVTLLEEEGDSVTFALVFPGDGDPAEGSISADSPLGAAVMGCGSGDRVEVMAPAGPRVITVLSVE
jgi:transcription elongation factor GreA